MSGPTGRRIGRRLASLLALALAVAACGGPLLANAPAAHPLITAAPAPSRPADPQPVALPRDDGAHDRLTEWWYYTGHLVDATGGHWGFEFVVFRAERGDFAVTWASHLALTDETGRAFHYAQRSEIGPQVNATGAAGASAGSAAMPFALAIRGLDANDPATFLRAPWSMAGGGGTDHLSASALPKEALGDPVAGFGLALDLVATKPPALHGGGGWVSFGDAGGSYYYSRTTMRATGSIDVGGKRLQVTGTAWFDHQWGDFISLGGGWDWFAINLDDGTDVTLSLVRGPDGTAPFAYGTLVDAPGVSAHLAAADFSVTVTTRWTSPVTGAVYPAGWSVSIPGQGLAITLAPTVAQQELDTRASTGVVYWEGSQRVTATREGTTVGGQGYVELTGYAPAP
jgi:predicted secreted hydrolase